MNRLHNIEKTQRYNKHWTGYGQGTVWRITGQSGAWTAVARDLPARVVSAATLAQISVLIDQDQGAANVHR
jgi:hypothetical protein